jgi:hypothetical protein
MDTSSDSDSEKGEHEAFIGGARLQLSNPTPTIFARFCSWAWIISTAMFAVATAVLSLKLRQQVAIDAMRTYEAGFDTDLSELPPARSTRVVGALLRTSDY